MYLIIFILLAVIYLLIKRIRCLLKVDNLEERHVFITGCDSGFGRELAIRLDRLGLPVFAGCLTEEGSQLLKKTCSARLSTILIDVTQTESIEKAVLFVEQSLPANKGIWALVNNAGILGNLSTFELCSKQDFSKVLNVNLLGPFNVTQLFLPLIRKSRGRIVNISSMVGRFPLFGAPYCVSKFALEALSDMLRRDVYGQGIHVSLLEPGGFNTSMVNFSIVKNELLESLKRASEEVRAVYQNDLTKWEITMEKIALISPNLTPVIDAYTHAVTSRFPSTRYIVGNDAKYLFIPLSYLPWIARMLKVSNYGDKFVFITGCDTGFGRELARRLDSLGFHVFAGCFNKELSQSLSGSSSNRLRIVHIDVSKAESIKEAVKKVKEQIPSEKGLWALVNNAGIGGSWAPSEMCTKEDFVPVFDVNFFGLVETTRLCLPLVRKAHGRIVNMASAAGILAFVAAPYTCSKFAVEAYSDIIRREMYQYSVKVSVLEPGVFKTSIVNVDKMVDLVKQVHDNLSTEVKDFYGPDAINRCRERFIGFNDNGASDVTSVVDAYTHAITARFPQKRYPVGTDCKVVFKPLSYFPSWFVDWYINFQVYGKGV